MKNVMNPADDALHEEWIDESGCINHVDMVAGGHNALGRRENCPSRGDFGEQPLIPSRPLIEVGSLVASPLDPAVGPPSCFSRQGGCTVQAQALSVCHQTVDLWLQRLDTCLCDNGSEINVRSDSFLPDNCVFDSPYPGTLEQSPGPSLSGGQRGCYISTYLVGREVLGMPANGRKLSLKITTSIVPK